MEATIDKFDPNFNLLKARKNDRGGYRPYTAVEITNIKLCHELHSNGHYSVSKMKEMIRDLPHCPLTDADVENWASLYLPCPSCVQGTYKAAPHRSFSPPTNAKPGEYWEMDVMFSEFEPN